MSEPRAWIPAIALVVLGLCAAVYARQHATSSTLLANERNSIGESFESLRDLEWQISENEALYRDLLDQQSDMILRRDPEGRLTFANEAFCRSFGIDPLKAIGERFAPAVLACEGPARRDGNESAIRQTFVELVETASGPRWIEWEEHRVAAMPGAPRQIQSVGRDVTEKRQAKLELERAKERAEAANQAKSRFLAAMSHEVRTPMNGILGMTSLMLESCTTSEQEAYTRAIDQSARKLLVVIDEILDFSKIEAGKIALIVRPFSLDLLIQNVIELMAPAAHEKGLEITWSVSRSLSGECLGDETRIRQVLLNLLSNAVKFTDQGGISLYAQRGEGPRSNEITLTVTDTGIGMSELDVQKIFEEFEQGDAAFRRQNGGTGLGLAISRRIARAMGGDLAAMSEPGMGSVFTLTIELPQNSNDARARWERPESAPVPRVLLAVERPIERRTMAGLLKEAGSDVTETALAEALDLVHQGGREGRPFTVIVVDADAAPEASQSLLNAARALCGQDPTNVRGIVLVHPLSRGRIPDFQKRGYGAYLIRPVRPGALLEQAGLIPKRPLSAPHSPSVEAVHAPGAPRVLVAEDNAINALLARRMLEKCGCDVIEAKTGREAVDAVRLSLQPDQRPYALILMDVLMPELDGVEATIQIIELYKSIETPGFARPPIVALTANAFAEDRQRYRDSGMDDYLAKPFDKPALEALLDRWLNRVAPHANPNSGQTAA